MGLTLIEAAKSADDLTRAYIEQYASTTEILMAIGFKNVDGNSYSYNLEHALPGVGFRGYNEGFDQSIGIMNPQSEAMKMCGRDLDVDMAMIATQGPSVRETQEKQQLKAQALAWTRNFIKGDSSKEPRAFDGLQVRVGGTQLLDIAAAGGALSLSKMDELIDLVDNPTHIIVNKTIARRMSAASRNNAVGGFVEFNTESMGKRITTYQGIPIIPVWQDNNDLEIMGFDEASQDASTTNNSSIYVVSFDDGMVEGLNFRNNEGGYGISVRDLGELETKPCMRTRIDWHTAIAVQHGRSVARLRGVKDLPVVA
jgi:hypothetical protein